MRVKHKNISMMNFLICSLNKRYNNNLSNVQEATRGFSPQNFLWKLSHIISEALNPGTKTKYQTYICVNNCTSATNSTKFTPSREVILQKLPSNIKQVTIVVAYILLVNSTTESRSRGQIFSQSR